MLQHTVTCGRSEKNVTEIVNWATFNRQSVKHVGDGSDANDVAATL